MALSLSSSYLFYQNKNFIKVTSSSIGRRASANIALCSCSLLKKKSWPQYHFLRCTVWGKSSKCESECEAGSSEPAIAENITINGMGELNNLNRKMSVIQYLRPQKTEAHLEIQISSRQLKMHINRWNREKKTRQALEAVKSTMKWITDVLNEWDCNFIPRTALATIVVLGILLVIPSANAVDALKTCACLLKECRVELARCIADPACAANVACLQTCNNRPDETECQIKCGDLFENSVVDQFNECAVSRKKCVPQKYDEGQFPVPDPSALVKNFNIADFSGKWYISSGLNQTFDTFDCQVHEFYPTSKILTGKLTWRITTPDGGFFTRSAIQKFVQDPSQPGILYNHDNEFLHYQDDWYILSSKIENKPDDYIFVYYRGRNDAWDGYGGSVVYTRSPVLPPSIVPELQKAASRAGLDFNKFRRTDNTCGPEPPLFARLEKKIEEGEQVIGKEVEELEEKVVEVGRKEMTLFQRLGKGLEEFVKDEENLLKGLSKEETELLENLKMEAVELERLFGKALPIRKLR